jgi:Holliday junction resolvase RusA-like endonuclease
MTRVHIQGKLPSLNDYIRACRAGPQVGNKMKREYEDIIMLQLGRMQRITEPVRVKFIWHEKNRRRDKDNVAFAKKFIFDAMQKAGKLINDNNDYIMGFSDEFVYGVDYGVTVIVEAASEREVSEKLAECFSELVKILNTDNSISPRLAYFLLREKILAAEQSIRRNR